MISDIAKLLTPVISSFFGFLFGLVALRLKELRDRKDTAIGFLIQKNLFVEQLSTHLTEVRSQISWLKVDPIFNSGSAINALVAVKEDVEEFSSDIRKILVTYSQWERGHFVDKGIRAQDVSRVVSELTEIKNRTQKMHDRLSTRSFWRYWIIPNVLKKLAKPPST